MGPTQCDGAIVYDDVVSPEDLPIGWTDSQEAGRYRLERRSDNACFGFAVGQHSWKQFLHPPKLICWEAVRHESGFEINSNNEPPPRFAFLGVRSCDLHAIGILDRVLKDGLHESPQYTKRRENIIIIAVNCTSAGNTCFCASMNTGPRVTDGYDLALTEIIDHNRHDFLVEAGSEKGALLVSELSRRKATAEDIAAAESLIRKTASAMGRQMDTSGIKELLQANLENRHWDRVADRCLACSNCTMVCPTCFCTTFEDHTRLDGNRASRVRRWDSCYTDDFSYIHGGSIRIGTAARYRHWITHKLANWIDQFGVSGCVGCGRCITWCPPGIDITEEVRELREKAAGRKEHGDGNS